MYKSYHHVQQTLFKDASSFNERKLDSLKSLKSMKNVILCLPRDKRRCKLVQARPMARQSRSRSASHSTRLKMRKMSKWETCAHFTCLNLPIKVSILAANASTTNANIFDLKRDINSGDFQSFQGGYWQHICLHASPGCLAA